VITMNVTERTGPVVGVLQVTNDEEQIMLVTNAGKMIRISVGEIRQTGRAAQGVRLVNLGEDAMEQLVSVAPVARDEVASPDDDGEEEDADVDSGEVAVSDGDEDES